MEFIKLTDYDYNLPIIVKVEDIKLIEAIKTPTYRGSDEYEYYTSIRLFDGVDFRTVNVKQSTDYIWKLLKSK